jgi:hypothetical protein
MEGTLAGVIREKAAEEDILAVLGRLTMAGVTYKMRNFVICTADHTLFFLQKYLVVGYIWWACLGMGETVVANRILRDNLREGTPF